jgi:hypothetical protein
MKKNFKDIFKGEGFKDSRLFFIVLLVIYLIFIGANEIDLSLKSFIGYMGIPSLVLLGTIWDAIYTYLKKK